MNLQDNIEQHTLMHKAMFVYLQGFARFGNEKLHNNLHLCSFYSLGGKLSQRCLSEIPNRIVYDIWVF